MTGIGGLKDASRIDLLYFSSYFSTSSCMAFSLASSSFNKHVQSLVRCALRGKGGGGGGGRRGEKSGGEGRGGEGRGGEGRGGEGRGGEGRGGEGRGGEGRVQRSTRTCTCLSTIMQFQTIYGYEAQDLDLVYWGYQKLTFLPSP